jgi:hypothetical protein
MSLSNLAMILLSVDCSTCIRSAALEKFNSSANTIAACIDRVSGSTMAILLAVGGRTQAGQQLNI